MGRILLYYHYTAISDTQTLKLWQRELCNRLNLRGRIIIAQEGINATVGGTLENIKLYKRAMRDHASFKYVDFKESEGGAAQFPKLSIKIRKEIVSLGIDPVEVNHKNAGKHLTPEKVNELIKTDKNLVILDARNDYEYQVGAFRGALNPGIQSFKELPEYIDKNIETFKNKKVLMYCTGGVRCERASTYLKSKGIDEVYQVKGGIHRYVEKYPDGHFRGKNYVFDSRITVKVNDDILGKCRFCTQPNDDYTNCSNASCNKHFITCESCKSTLLNTCSKSCYARITDEKAKTRPAFRKQHAL